MGKNEGEGRRRRRDKEEMREGYSDVGRREENLREFEVLCVLFIRWYMLQNGSLIFCFLFLLVVGFDFFASALSYRFPLRS